MRTLGETVASLVLATLLASGRFAWAGSCPEDAGILQRLETESMLEDVALIHSLDPGLLSAIAQVESRECSDAVSSKGAAGLMQLMPATASEFGVEDRMDPLQNALGAARFIDYLKRERPDGKLSLAEIVAAYNAGEGAVTRAHGIPHYRETEAYVRRVLWLYLLGHVPESERSREAAASKASLAEKASARRPALAAKTSRNPAPGSDAAILEQLADVRRARQAAESAPNSR
jgi:transglycosylase-like protein with SLT domain